MDKGRDDETSRPRHDDEEEEEELMEWEAPYYKDTVLWVIDNSEAMHDIDPQSGKSYLHRSIEVACRMMEHKLIRSPSDKIGILLFNTRQTHVPVVGKKMTHPGCYAIVDIQQVNVPTVVTLRDDLAEADRSPEGATQWFRNKYPPDTGQVRIHYVLTNAESMLNSAGKTGSRRIFWVTNNDDPYAGRSARTKLHRGALDKIKDMIRRGIETEAFLISTNPAKPFDTAKFYADLFQAYDDGAEELKGDVGLGGGNDSSTTVRVKWNAFDKFEDLEADAGARETPKRVTFRIGMELADGLTIGIAGYNLVIRSTNNTGAANRGHPVNVYREDEDDLWQEVVTTSHLQCKDTGQILDGKTQVDHAFALGFDTSPRGTVRFSPEEITKLKTSGIGPGLKVLGYKDRSELRFWENVKHSVFIFPSDAEYTGSQRTFSALLQVMLAKDKIGIALFSPRPSSIPEFVAIIPQAEECDSETGVQTEPGGMHLIPLPFADDIREMPDSCAECVEATPDQVEKAGKVVSRFSRSAAFNPDFYPNPALNYHFEALKAVAFGVDIEDPVDKSLPDYVSIRNRCGREISELHKSVNSDARLDPLSSSALPVVTSEKKRAIVIDSAEEQRLLDVHTRGNLMNKKVDYLKAACDHYRVARGGNKPELVARLGIVLDKVLVKRGIERSGEE